MNIQVRLSLISAILLASPAYAQGPSWSDAQAEVWAVVEQSWQDDAGETGNWPGEYAHEEFVAWGDSFPAPRDKIAYDKWERTDGEGKDVFWYEVTPLAIALKGATAVVMYSALMGEEATNGERSFTAYHIVEMLTREGRDWRFLASTSFTPDYSR